MEPGAAWEVPHAWDIVPNIRKLIDCCRETDIPIVFTEYFYAPNVPCLHGDPFVPEHLPAQATQPPGFGFPSGNTLFGQEGPNSPDVIDELKRLPEELIIQGHTYDKVFGTRLDLALRSQDIRYLIITGICVNCTLA